MAKVVLEDFNVLLVFFRTGQGWGQSELADAAGILASLLNDYERGRKPLTRNRLEYLAGVMGIPPERIDESLACLAANRSAAAGGGQAPDGPGATRRRVEAVAIRAGRLMTDFTRSLLNLMTAEGEALVARQRAERQMARLRKCTPAERLFLVEEGRHFRHWALAESAALESVAKAPNHPQEALEWARLAVRIAELAPGEEAWRWRLEGWTLHFQANAERACNVLPAARQSLARAWKLWKAGEGGDPGRLLNEVWLPWIESNLLRAERHFAEALLKIDEALDLDQGERRGQILLSKSLIFKFLGDPAASTEVLLEAEPLIDARREPRLAFGVRFNLLADLSDLGRAVEARPRLGAVREVAERLGEPLDLTRCTWLHGKIEAGLGNLAEAVAAFTQVQRDFREAELAYDCALVSLDLSLVLLELGHGAKVAAVAEQMLWIFKSQGVHREALAALHIFCDAARREVATVELARKIAHFLRRAQLDPELRFEAEGPKPAPRSGPSR
jgi:transcriptional regulator with XRE-family HTH domain